MFVFKSLLLLPLMLLAAQNSVEIPAGEYRPIYLSKDSPYTLVKRYSIDVLPVTNRQFYFFVTANPRWQPQAVPQLFAEPQYLQHWTQHTNEWKPAVEVLASPVTNVSWFAAQAYCRFHSKRLPTVSEWERVASASETLANGAEEQDYKQRILDWYSLPNSQYLPAVGNTRANFWGVHDLHGLIWEWTEDFNSSLVSGESRGGSSIDQKLFCAAGVLGAADPSDYAAFMRYGFRSSLQAKFTISNLGFRCAFSEE